MCIDNRTDEINFTIVGLLGTPVLIIFNCVFSSFLRYERAERETGRDILRVFRISFPSVTGTSAVRLLFADGNGNVYLDRSKSFI